jgi:[ribosomal protein S5]-alanine N-acetyltransferase
MTAPTIRTARLELRPFERDDAADVFAYASDPLMLQYTTGVTPRTVADSARFVEMLIAEPEGAYALAVRVVPMPEVVGSVEFGMDGRSRGQIHYGLARACWGNGYATEACRAVLTWAFEMHVELRDVVTSAMTANPASRRVMQKCGMRFTRVYHERWEKYPSPVELAEHVLSRQRWLELKDTW